MSFLNRLTPATSVVLHIFLIIGLSKSNSRKTNPQIWLSEYVEGGSDLGVAAEREFKTLDSFQTEVISKNGTNYIIDHGIIMAAFACQAKYPIKWRAPHMTQIRGMMPYYIASTSIRASVFPPEVDKPINSHFTSFLIVRNSMEDFYSVSFTCTSLDSTKGDPSQTIHVYLDRDKVLEMEGETISVSMKHPAETLTLPCRPSHPDISIRIEKEVHDGYWKEFSLKHMSFDPRLGFTMPWNKGLIGLYKCSVNGSDVGRDEDPYVFINVTSVDHQGVDPSTFYKPGISHKGNSILKRNETSLRIFCCSGVGQTIREMDFEGCEDPLQCDIIRDYIYLQGKVLDLYFASANTENSSCSEIYRLRESPSLVQCHAGGVDLAEEFVEMFIPGVTWVDNRTTLWEDNEYEYSKTPLTIFRDTGEVDGASAEEKMLISVGYNVSLEEYRKMNHSLRSVSFLGLDATKSALLSSLLEPANPVPGRIAEYHRNHYYEGEPLVVICLGVKYLYTEGGHLRLNWKNGSGTILERIGSERKFHVYFHGNALISGNGLNFLSLFGMELKASPEMKSVDCFMPLGNDEWDKLNYNISTRDSTPPKLVGGGEEDIVYFHLNDMEKEISWEVAEGAPLPETTVTKDGKQLSSEDYGGKLVLEEYNGNGSSNVIKIKFTQVTYEMQGIYEVIVQNLKGKDMKTIKIVLSDKQSSATFVIIVLVCVGVTVASLALLFIICMKYKRQLRQLREPVIS